MRKWIAIAVLCLMLPLLCSCARKETDEAAAEPTETSAPAVETEAATEPSTQPQETVPETIPVTQPTEPEPEPPGEIITEGVRVRVAKGDYTEILCDNSYHTKKHFNSTEILSVESETPFAALYILWDKMPGSYQIQWEGGSCSGGEYGFLHEYIRLPEAVTGVEFVFEEESRKELCDVKVITAGSAPEGIQVWLPPCDEADILVFPTHSDDDVLFFGPLIAYYSIERELAVQTAFMVQHTFYPHRSHERLNGLWTLGVRHYPILGKAPDTGTHSFGEAMEYYAASNIEQWQVEQIRQFKPLVVVGHDLKGEYGNGGHKVNAYYLVRAVEAALDPEQYPESADLYGVWNTPKFYLHLYEENEIYLDVETPLEKDPQGRTLHEIATAAFEYHISQKAYLKVSYGELRQYDCRPFGLYRTLVGYDTQADIMENIDAAQWRNTEKS